MIAKTNRRTLVAALLAPLVIGASVRARAQEGSIQGFDEQPAFSATASLVVVDVVVLDDQQRPVSGLPQERFKLLEDGVARPIQIFRQEDAPVSIGFLVDSSTSMLGHRATVIGAAEAFLQESNPADHAAVINFCDEVYLDLAFSQNLARVRTALLRPYYQGTTRVWDALLATLTYMHREAPDERSVIILFTDGWDTGSSHQFRDVLAAVSAHRQPTPVYILVPAGAESSDRALNDVRLLAQATGGRVVAPKTPEAAITFARRTAREVRARYVLAYEPAPDTEVGEHRLQVLIEGGAAYSVSHRQHFAVSEEDLSLMHRK